jgi:hypothetical protein
MNKKPTNQRTKLPVTRHTVRKLTNSELGAVHAGISTGGDDDTIMTQDPQAR